MLKKKLLTLLYKYSFILFSILFFYGCSNVSFMLVKKSPYKIYVPIITEVMGMQLKEELSKYFDGTNSSASPYTLKVGILINDDLLLTNVEGFATQNKAIATIKWSLTDNKTKKTVFETQEVYTTYYDINNSYYSSVSIKEKQLQVLAEMAAKDISIKVRVILNKLAKKNENKK